MYDTLKKKNDKRQLPEKPKKVEVVYQCMFNYTRTFEVEFKRKHCTIFWLKALLNLTF